MFRAIKSQKLGEINELLTYIYNFAVYNGWRFDLPRCITRKAWATYCHITELELYKKGLRLK